MGMFDHYEEREQVAIMCESCKQLLIVSDPDDEDGAPKLCPLCGRPTSAIESLEFDEAEKKKKTALTRADLGIE